MSNVIEGVIHGKTIELAVDPGLKDGQRVRVQVIVRPVADLDAQRAALMRVAGSMADDPEFDAVMEEVADARKPDTETPRPQRVRVVGDLDMIRMSGRGFELLLDDGSYAGCVLVEGDIADLKPLVGHRVLVQGIASYQPSGHLLRIDVERVGPGHGESDVWSVIPPPRKRTIDTSQLHKPQGPSNGVSAFFGTWPGDESDEAWGEMIERLS